jgi:hypothetical protein
MEATKVGEFTPGRFMLFVVLAVIIGILAEKILEHVANQMKISNYMKQNPTASKDQAKVATGATDNPIIISNPVIQNQPKVI